MVLMFWLWVGWCCALEADEADGVLLGLDVAI